MLPESYLFSPLRRLVATPPEIYRSEATLGTRYSGRMDGRRFLLYSDFPVGVYFDGRLVGAAGAPAFPPFYRFNFGGASILERNVDFRFPPGFGGDPAGGLNPTEAELGRHGTCYLLSTWSDEGEPMLPDPDYLPVTQALLLSGIPVADNKPAGLWQNLPLAASSLFSTWPWIQDATDLWLKSAGIGVEDAQMPADPISFCYEVNVAKDASGVGISDAHVLFSIQQSTTFAQHCMPNVKIPWRSLRSPWAGEAPTIRASSFGTPLYTSIGGGGFDLVLRLGLGVLK